MAILLIGQIRKFELNVGVPNAFQFYTSKSISTNQEPFLLKEITQTIFDKNNYGSELTELANI